MKKLTEGQKMFWSVMAIFAIFAAVFITFDDYDRAYFRPFDDRTDWHMLFFAVAVLMVLGVILYRYAKRMDERLSREQNAKEYLLRRELTQNIAHELKTPVAGIQGYCETLLENPHIDPDLERRFLERMLGQVKRLVSLLQDMSTLNRMDFASHLLKKERVDVSALVADLINETAPLISKQGMTVINYLPQSIVVQGDRSLLYSVFSNLMNNAINYAGEGSTIAINATDGGNEWQFSFSDNGQGIASEHLPRIFERFYRVDKGRSRALGGTGLGLSVVKNAVQFHGGTITARAAVPSGLCLNFTLSKR